VDPSGFETQVASEILYLSGLLHVTGSRHPLCHPISSNFYPISLADVDTWTKSIS